ncbi:sensor histidine kinase [Allohahella marinimesophila]|uniref:histidine kinase n=1 Tax=Allohahella marinimesophila TaxID=1054972 RepID=A0ABP7PV30_9GAMM
MADLPRSLGGFYIGNAGTVDSAAYRKLFRVYNNYRVVVGLILLTTLLFQFNTGTRSFLNPLYYQILVASYLAIHVFVALLLLAGLRPRMVHVLASLLLEIGLLGGMLFFSSGVNGGVASLIVINVAAGCMLHPGRKGLLLAATGTLVVMAQEIYRFLLSESELDSVVESGVFGIAYFTAAVVIQNLSSRLISSETLAQKRAHEITELQTLNHLIIQRMLTGIIVTNKSLEVKLMNESTRAMLGIQNQRIPERLPQEIAVRLMQWKQNSEVSTEPLLPSTADSGQAPLQLSFAYLAKNHNQDVLIFIEDTSKVVMKAQHLKLASLGRLTASIAHEIRNPLGAASHAAQLLSESETLSEQDKSLNEIVLRHASRMNRVVENILQLSRSRSSNIERIELNDWLKEFVNEYRRFMAPDAVIEFEVDSGVDAEHVISGQFDSGHLHQILSNLMNNAVKFTKLHSGEGYCKVILSELQTSRQARICVEDKGPGLTPAQQQNVFEPFFTTDKNGTGLGLYLSRELCQANQAQLTFSNLPEGGARFCLTLSHPKRKVSAE